MWWIPRTIAFVILSGRTGECVGDIWIGRFAAVITAADDRIRHELARRVHVAMLAAFAPTLHMHRAGSGRPSQALQPAASVKRAAVRSRCSSGTKQSPETLTTGSMRRSRRTPLLLAWRCSSAGRAGSRVRAVVAHSARARLDLGDRSSARSGVVATLGPASTPRADYCFDHGA